MNPYLKESRILDYNSSIIKNLISTKKWKMLEDTLKVKEIYNFVRNEIKFGYNISDDISASQVLEEGIGQCNTKANLLMALLRGVGIENRIHGFTIHKELQKGAITGIWYRLSPKNILHSWVEVNLNNQWYYLEGVILDDAYLSNLQNLNPNCTNFCGYGADTENLNNPSVEWNLNHTYIQHKGINQDFGIFNTPDEFYTLHQQNLGVFKKLIFQKIVRKKMNLNVQKIRNQNQKK